MLGNEDGSRTLDWRARIGIIAERWATVDQSSEPSQSSLDGVRTYATGCELVDAGTPRARLVWGPDSGRSSPPLTTCLREFVSLARPPDGEIESRIHDFAARFGPLYEVAPGSWKGGERQTVEEPVMAWRRLAEGYGAMLAMVSDVRTNLPIRAADWPRAMATLAIPAWLADQTGAPEPPGENDLASLASWHLGAGHDLGSQEAEREALGRLIGMVMALSGLRVDAYLDVKGNVHLAYALPGMRGEPDDGDWRVPGLVPVLAFQTAEAIDNDWTFRCTWCGKAAVANERRPRKGLEWYGDHDKCREAARKATRKAYRAKARGTRTTSKLDSHRDSQVGG